MLYIIKGGDWVVSEFVIVSDCDWFIMSDWMNRYVYLWIGSRWGWSFYSLEVDLDDL